MIHLAPPRRYLQPEHTDENFLWHEDCRHFVGGLPCKFWRPCLNCPHHDPVDHRVLIVMLGLHGDMLIASPLPTRIKREHPGAHITWLTDPAHAALLRMMPDVDRVLEFDWRAATHLAAERFDAVYSFEREPAAAALVERVEAGHKAGLAYGGKHNALYAIGEAARHFFKMNTWNDYRTLGNTKTWTELYFEVAGFTYAGEPYVLEIPEEAHQRVRALLGIDGDVAPDGNAQDGSPLIGLNTGSSLAIKMWPEEHWLALGRLLLDGGHRLVITGGPKERAMCERLHTALTAYSGPERVVYDQLTVEEFSAVFRYCDTVVTGDTFGFHLALLHQRPCVLLLGPSNPDEVVPKHVRTVTELRSTLPCAPCAHQVACGGVGGCTATISAQEAAAAVHAHLARAKGPEHRTVN